MSHAWLQVNENASPWNDLIYSIEQMSLENSWENVNNYPEMNRVSQKVDIFSPPYYKISNHAIV